MQWLHQHRLILVIYVFGLFLGVSEALLPEDRSDFLDHPSAFLPPEVNVADVSAEIHPDRALTLYYRAYQASLCAGPPATSPSECRDRDPVGPDDVRDLIERSLATGNRSIEMAMYNYVIVLIQDGARPEAIDAAIVNWKISYPGSSLTDPREMVEQMMRRRK